MKIRVPASSANIGPGFDALGVALTLYAELETVDESSSDAPSGGDVRSDDVVTDSHPALVAFRQAGGRGTLRVRSAIPSGRGLGFSGAVRVGAVALALRQQFDHDVLVHDRRQVFSAAARLEGHGDNVAASLYGGATVAADDEVGRIALALDPVIVAWVPSHRTSTAQSRQALPDQVSRADAVFNLARTGLLVAALSSGDRALLREATRDRLHQDARLTKSPESRAALDAFASSSAWATWLSGSGPTVCAMCDPSDVESISARLPEGRVLRLAVDRVGAAWAD